MEMVKTYGFCEMTYEDMYQVEGGSFTLTAFLVMVGKGALAAAGGWLVCKGLDHTYNAVGRWTGWW